MERETKKIKTENHVVEIKTYITAGEKRQLRDVLLKGLKMDIAGETPRISDFSPEIITEAENKAIEIMIVSIDGNKENIFQRFMEFRSDEYDQVMEEIDKITREVVYSVKKKT
jgi:CRISPR/Cas system CMR-associated protein Cmr1 (group 7 of RAMP superfamily)